MESFSESAFLCGSRYLRNWKYNRFITLLFAGPHPGSPGQMEPDRRRDLGESDRPGEEQKGGEGVREGAGADRQRLRRRI